MGTSFCNYLEFRIFKWVAMQHAGVHRRCSQPWRASTGPIWQGALGAWNGWVATVSVHFQDSMFPCAKEFSGMIWSLIPFQCVSWCSLSISRLFSFSIGWFIFFLHWIPLAGTGSVWGPEAHDPADWRGSCSATGSQARGPRQSPSTLSLQSPFEIFWAMCYRCGWDLKTRICWNLEVLILKHL